MAIANVIRLGILGTMPGGEVWSVNPVWQIGGVSTSEDVTDAMAAAMATACAAVSVPAGILAAFSGQTNLTAMRVEARRWNGELAAIAEAPKSPTGAGSGTAPHPFQTSIVTSLKTGAPGGSGRGRLYWPATGLSINGVDLRVPNTELNNLLSGVKTYLTSLTSALDASLVNSPILSVWSRTNASTLPVTSIQAGNVLDTQRRRRDAVPETRASVSFP